MGSRQAISASPCASVVAVASSPSPWIRNVPGMGFDRPSRTRKNRRCSTPGTRLRASGELDLGCRAPDVILASAFSACPPTVSAPQADRLRRAVDQQRGRRGLADHYAFQVGERHVTVPRPVRLLLRRLGALGAGPNFDGKPDHGHVAGIAHDKLKAGPFPARHCGGRELCAKGLGPGGLVPRGQLEWDSATRPSLASSARARRAHCGARVVRRDGHPNEGHARRVGHKARGEANRPP